MLLSIVVLSYNRPKQIERILKNFLDTADIGFNLIIKDDASPSKKEIESIVEKYSSILNFEVKFHANKKNMGYDANLMDAFCITDSDYVMLLSDDDYIDGGNFHKIIDCLSNKNEDFYFTPYEKDLIVNRNPLDNYDFSRFSEVIYNSILFSGLVFRRIAVNKLMLDFDFLKNSIYSQVYIASSLIYQAKSYGVLPVGVLKLGGDGENFFGKNESANNSNLLSDREKITADLTYQQFLLKTVRHISARIDNRIENLFEKEYVKRLCAYGLRSRSLGLLSHIDFLRFYISGGNKVYLVPTLFFVSILILPSFFAKKFYTLGLNLLKKSG